MMVSQKKGERIDYQYVESGLDNVIIRGMEVKITEEGEKIYCIPNINGLHKAIAHHLLIQDKGIAPKELRFIRSEMGFTQEELAEVLVVNRVTISRWESENAKEHIDANAEFKLRLLAAEKLEINLNMTTEELSKYCVWKARSRQFVIDGSDPGNYRPVAA